MHRDGSSDLSLQDDEWSDLRQDSNDPGKDLEECVGSSFDLTEDPSSKKRTRHTCRGHKNTSEVGHSRLYEVSLFIKTVAAKARKKSFFFIPLYSDTYFYLRFEISRKDSSGRVARFY